MYSKIDFREVCPVFWWFVLVCPGLSRFVHFSHAQYCEFGDKGRKSLKNL